MKVHIKSLCFFGILVSFFVFGSAKADNSGTCPAGCFCYNSMTERADIGGIGSLFGRTAQSGNAKSGRVVQSGGAKIGRAAQSGNAKIGRAATDQANIDTIQQTVLCNKHASPLTSIQNSNHIKKYKDISVALSRSSGVVADYYVEDFSEFYESELGFYGFLNNKFVYGYAQNDYAMLACPESFPNSESGSTSLSQCFKYDTSGNKVYYAQHFSRGNSGGNSDVSVLLNNLQSALAQANKAVQDLQRVLGTSNNPLSDEADIEAIKAMIKSGI